MHIVDIGRHIGAPRRLALARSARLGSLHPTGMPGIVATAVDGRANVGSINSEVTDNT